MLSAKSVMEEHQRLLQQAPPHNAAGRGEAEGMRERETERERVSE